MRRFVPFVLSCAFAVAAAHPGEASHDGTIALEGTITDEAGTPIEGVCVDLMLETRYDAWIVRDVAQTGPDGTVVLERNRFHVSRYQLASAYRVRFRDCRPRPVVGFEWFDDVTDVTQALQLSPEVRTVANAALAPAASLGGRVTDPGGATLEGICVLLYDGTIEISDDPYWVPYETRTTNANGAYRFDGLAAKEYRLLYHGDKPLPPYSSSSPCAGKGRYFAEWFEDRPGELPRWPGWPASDPLRLAAEERTRIDVALEPRPIVARGTVTDEAGRLIEGICIDVLGMGEYARGLHAAVTMTDEEGRFELERAQVQGAWDTYPARYAIRFRDCRPQPDLAFEWFDDVNDMSLARVLVADEIVEASASLSPGGTVQGRIVDVRGAPVADACALLYDGTFSYYGYDREWVPYEARATGPDGRYRFDGLATKGYRLLITNELVFGSSCTGNPRVIPEWYDDRPGVEPTENPDWPPSDVIEVGPAQQVSIDAALALKGRITGHISSGSSRCLAVLGVHITAWPSAQVPSDPGGSSGLSYTCDGDYSVLVPAGSYKLRFVFWHDTRGVKAATEWWDDHASWASSDAVIVADGGDVTGIDADLSGCAPVRYGPLANRGLWIADPRLCPVVAGPG